MFFFLKKSKRMKNFWNLQKNNTFGQQGRTLIMADHNFMTVATQFNCQTAKHEASKHEMLAIGSCQV